MSGKSTRPTLQDIADRTGYGRSTVSLALRNHPSLPAKTREKIRRAAEAIGYRPNPLVAALMAQLRGGPRRYRETIAVVTRRDHPMDCHLSPLNFYRILYRALEEHCQRWGFQVDRFRAGKELSGSRLSRILTARGIHGVIFFPGGAPGDDYPVLDWPHFAPVLVGFNAKWPMFHQVVSDYSHDIDLALRVAVQQGSRRIGFAVSHGHDGLVDSGWSSRFLNYQRHLPARHRVPFLPSFDRRAFLDWVRRHRPDTLLIAGDECLPWIKEAGYRVPEELRLINLVQRGEKDLAGIDPRTDEVGRGAVDLLLSLLQGNQFGLPEFPRVIAIKGRWMPGPSFPENRTPSSAS